MCRVSQENTFLIIKRWQDFTGKEAIHAESGKIYNEIKNNQGML